MHQRAKEKPSYRFNSRTREGCDNFNGQQLTDAMVSIHAPARGAITKPGSDLYRNSFNSRTREGCDADMQAIRNRWLFQFTHPRGVRFRWFQT